MDQHCPKELQNKVAVTKLKKTTEEILLQEF